MADWIGWGCLGLILAGFVAVVCEIAYEVEQWAREGRERSSDG